MPLSAEILDALVLAMPATVKWLQRRFSLSRADAEDHVQGAACLVLSGKAIWGKHSGFFTWFCAVARYEWLNNRRAHRHKLYVDSPRYFDLADRDTITPGLVRSVIWQTVMNDPCSHLLQRFYWDGVLAKDLARELGITKSAISQRFSVAYRRMRWRLEGLDTLLNLGSDPRDNMWRRGRYEAERISRSLMKSR